MNFPDKIKLMDFITTKPVLSETLKGSLYEGKIKNVNNKMLTYQ